MLEAQSIESPIKQALRLGQSIWYDGLLPPHEFQKLIEEVGIRGATTNPAIFEKALASTRYETAIRRLARHGQSAEVIYRQLSVEAVRDVADTFEPVYRESGGTDGYVSIEVSPLLAYDVKLTVSQATELFSLIDRKNVMIKVPATKEGLSAIEHLIAYGIPVNATLIFSVTQYREVAEATIRGLERRLVDGGSLRDEVSVASFFVSRLDTEVDRALQNKLMVTHSQSEEKLLKSLMGKAAVANAKIAYGEYEKIFLTPRFEVLRNAGARAQRPLWASTGTKNPMYRDVLYVEMLMGPNTVNTMPPATLEAFQDHGICQNQIRSKFSEAQETIKQLKFCKISIEEISARLQESGVSSFCDSYNKIIQKIGEMKK